MPSPLNRFTDLIRAASEADLRSDPTLAGRLVLERQGDLVVSYAPFEHVHLGARVVVGITPGAQQAVNALCELRRRLMAGDGHGDALVAAKVFASFSGPIRANLVALLDHVRPVRCGRLMDGSSISPPPSATPCSLRVPTTTDSRR